MILISWDAIERFRERAHYSLAFMPVMIGGIGEYVYMPMRKCVFGHFWFVPDPGTPFVCEACAKIAQDDRDDD